MKHALPIADTVVQDNFTTDKVRGGTENDHLIHHRDPSLEGHSSVGLAGFAGDDILEGSVPHSGQIHMFGATGNDWFVLDVTKSPDAIGMQGHHAYGGPGRDTFQFHNIANNAAPIVGRLDDFDPTSDRILVEDTEIDLTNLPRTVDVPGGKDVEVRVVDIEHPEFIAENLGSQHFLAIGDNAFYALEGARDLKNGTSDLTGEERHFLKPDALETLREAETVSYANPTNFVPREFFEDREDDLALNWNPPGQDVLAETGGKTAAHMFGSKNNPDAPSSDGEQVMTGSVGDDVIDTNNGNDTVFGGDGNDLIAAGIDNDVANGGNGDDMIWGGDGDDSLNGDSGDDYLHGGRGDDTLAGGEGHDTLVGGEGNDTLEGGGGEDAVNRFHFYDDGGDDTITDFKVGLDKITLQDDIEPLTVELFENEDGNTVLNYAQAGSVEMRGVGLEGFRDAAEVRAEADDPIITITPDPEEEMLRELRIETGFYGDAQPPDLMVEGITYGDAPFRTSAPGGHSFVSENDGGAGSGEDDSAARQDERSEVGFASEIPVIDEKDRPKDEDETDDEDEQADPGTCFVATAAYHDPMHPDVVFLRAFRDQWLVRRAWGRVCIALYWRIGPKMAGPVRRNPRLACRCKVMISLVVVLLRRVWARGPVRPFAMVRPGFST